MPFICFKGGGTMKSRVFITGLNVISPLCHTKDGFAECLYNPPEDELAKQTADLDTLAAGNKKVRRMNRVSLGAFLSAGQALEDRHLSAGDYDPFDVGCIITAASPSLDSTVNFLSALYNEGADYTSPMSFSNSVANACLAAVAVNLKLKGPSNLLLSGNSLKASYLQLKKGKSQIIISGSYEDQPPDKLRICDNLTYTNKLKDGVCRPYAADPKGIYVKEEYVSLVCEGENSSYLNAGTRVYCEICGFGTYRKHTADTTRHMDDFYPGDFEKAMNLALESAGIQTDRIDAVIGAGGEHITLDAAEARAVSDVFGKKVPVLSVKGIFGDNHGANFNLNAAAAAVIFEKGKLPAAYNCGDCSGLINTVKQCTGGDFRYIMVNGYCEYGNIMSCVLKKY